MHTSDLPDGSIALVTGASAGIGEQTARALNDAGYRVICAARRESRLQALVAELGKRTIALSLDVSDDASVDALYSRLPEAWHAIDILVNNAGHDVGGRRRFHEGDADEWLRIIDTNVSGMIRVTRKVIEGMLARDRGHIVNLGSIAGIVPYAGGTIYAGSKHAVHGFSQSLRLDYAKTGIRVSEIMPGMVRTEFAATRFRSAEKGAAFYDEFGVCLTPQDIARSVVFALGQPLHVEIAQLVVMPSGR